MWTRGQGDELLSDKGAQTLSRFEGEWLGNHRELQPGPADLLFFADRCRLMFPDLNIKHSHPSHSCSPVSLSQIR